jgi:hypothetical protein
VSVAAVDVDDGSVAKGTELAEVKVGALEFEVAVVLSTVLSDGGWSFDG